MFNKVLVFWICTASLLFSIDFQMENAANIYQEDFNLLTKKIVESHPGFYGEAPILDVNNINYLYTVAMESLSDIDSNTDFYFIVSKFLKSLHDGHANITYGMFDYLVLPIHFTWINGELYVTEVYKEKYEECKNKVVVKVNNMSVDFFEQAINDYLPSDYNNYFRMRREIFGSNFQMVTYDFHKRIFPDVSDHITLTFNDKSTIDINYVNVMQCEEIFDDTVCARNDITKALFKHSYQIYKNYDIAYYQASSKKLTEGFVESLFQDIKDNEIDNLIIDLRNCGGGAGGEGIIEFIPYLISEEREIYSFNGYVVRDNELVLMDGNQSTFTLTPVSSGLQFKGNVYIFVNSFTFSAANLATLIFKNNKLAIIMGEPTGNNYTRFGHSCKVFLPNTEMKASFSTKLWENVHGKNEFTRTIEPDIFVAPTIVDYVTGTDAVWDYCLKYINK